VGRRQASHFFSSTELYRKARNSYHGREARYNSFFLLTSFVFLAASLFGVWTLHGREREHPLF
jgi:hypothetical protein